MMHDMLQQAANNAMAMGPTVLVQGTQLRRPTDLVKTPSLSTDDKRAILAAWASDFYAVDSKPALRQLPGTPEPISIPMSAKPEFDRVSDAVDEVTKKFATEPEWSPMEYGCSVGDRSGSNRSSVNPQLRWRDIAKYEVKM